MLENVNTLCLWVDCEVLWIVVLAVWLPFMSDWEDTSRGHLLIRHKSHAVDRIDCQHISTPATAAATSRDRWLKCDSSTPREQLLPGEWRFQTAARSTTSLNEKIDRKIIESLRWCNLNPCHLYLYLILCLIRRYWGVSFHGLMDGWVWCIYCTESYTLYVGTSLQRILFVIAVYFTGKYFTANISTTICLCFMQQSLWILLVRFRRNLFIQHYPEVSLFTSQARHVWGDFIARPLTAE